MKILIVGAGGHGRVVLDILTCAHEHEVLGFVDSDLALTGRRIDGLPVLGALNELPRLREALGVQGAIVAVGDNGVRRAQAGRVARFNMPLVNAVHPSANLALNVTLGSNVVIAAGALVCAHCHVGDSAILNTGCIVDHESMIGPAAHVCPGARLAGRVHVEAGAFIGIGATVIQGLKIGYGAIVGAGAVVIHDVGSMTTVVGVPAKRVRTPASAEDSAVGMLPEPTSGPMSGWVRAVVEAREGDRAESRT